MIAAEIIGQVLDAGGQISVDGADLALTAPRPLPADLLDSIKAHKPALLEALAHPDPRTSLSAAALAELPAEDPTCPAWRVSIAGPKALNIDFTVRSAWTVSDWGRFARRHYGPHATVVTRAAAAPLASPDLPGVSPELQARLSAEDLDDVGTGTLTLGTVQAFEQAAIAREARDLRGFFEERAAILEHDAGLPRADAELEAARITATLARNQGYLWASLRTALADYPVLLSQLPNKPGPVDALSFGAAAVAVLPGGRVVRQGVFSGAHEVKP